MASTATAGCNPTTCNSNRPQRSSWIDRGIASNRRMACAGHSWPRQVRQTVRELASPSTSPANRLVPQPSNAIATVTPRPSSREWSTSGSRDGVTAATANSAIRSQPPPWTSPGRAINTGTTARAGNNSSSGGAGLMQEAPHCHRDPAGRPHPQLRRHNRTADDPAASRSPDQNQPADRGDAG